MAQARTSNIIRHGLEMRTVFNCEALRLTNWFPRHMYTGLLQVQAKLHSIDAVIEVHDARIPFTGRNEKLTDIGISKPSILVMNKIDLVDPSNREPLRRRFQRMNKDVVFTNCKNSGDGGIKSLVPSILDLLKQSDRYNRAANPEYNIMVIGIPNIGKSSLINALRSHNVHQKKCAPVAPRPGVTRAVMERIRILHKPEIFVRDTPGVLAPRIPYMEAGIKLSLCAVVDDRIVGNRVMADYLLFWLNSRGRHEYADHFKLSAPTDDIRKLLVTIAVRNGYKRSHRTMGEKVFPDLDKSASNLVALWRKGALGCAMLDDDYFS